MPIKKFNRPRGEHVPLIPWKMPGPPPDASIDQEWEPDLSAPAATSLQDDLWSASNSMVPDLSQYIDSLSDDGSHVTEKTESDRAQTENDTVNANPDALHLENLETGTDGLTDHIKITHGSSKCTIDRALTQHAPPLTPLLRNANYWDATTLTPLPRARVPPSGESQLSTRALLSAITKSTSGPSQYKIILRSADTSVSSCGSTSSFSTKSMAFSTQPDASASPQSSTVPGLLPPVNVTPTTPLFPQAHAATDVDASTEDGIPVIVLTSAPIEGCSGWLRVTGFRPDDAPEELPLINLGVFGTTFVPDRRANRNHYCAMIKPKADPLLPKIAAWLPDPTQRRYPKFFDPVLIDNAKYWLKQGDVTTSDINVHALKLGHRDFGKTFPGHPNKMIIDFTATVGVDAASIRIIDFMFTSRQKSFTLSSDPDIPPFWKLIEFEWLREEMGPGLLIAVPAHCLAKINANFPCACGKEQHFDAAGLGKICVNHGTRITLACVGFGRTPTICGSLPDYGVLARFMRKTVKGFALIELHVMEAVAQHMDGDQDIVEKNYV